MDSTNLTPITKLEILYQDAYLVAINKPHGLLVHKSPIAAQATQFALQLLRNQLQQYVYPVHRIDRKTAGVLLFALQPETAAAMQTLFVTQQLRKRYLAIVRGFFPASCIVNYALKNDRNKVQQAITHFKTIQQAEIPVAFGKFASSRYSLITAYPQTGRMHQIRKHCKHLRHPIIGDRPYGCNKQNALFKQKWQMITTLLHAESLHFEHPILNKKVYIKAPVSNEFQRMQQLLFNGVV